MVSGTRLAQMDILDLLSWDGIKQVVYEARIPGFDKVSYVLVMRVEKVKVWYWCKERIHGEFQMFRAIPLKIAQQAPFSITSLLLRVPFHSQKQRVW
jgi:hypothetical protein